MSANYGGYLNRKKSGRKQTEREKKKSLLAERRRPINIDHLKRDKLVEKVGEMQDWFEQLEEDRYSAFEKFCSGRYLVIFEVLSVLDIVGQKIEIFKISAPHTKF